METNEHKKPPNTTIHVVNGVKYLYSVNSFWDKEKKAPRNHQICLGLYDEKTGKAVKKKKVKRGSQSDLKTADVKIIGPSSVFDKICDETNLKLILKASFPDSYNLILSTAYYILQKGKAISRINSWSQSNKHPYGNSIINQRISSLLGSIDPSKIKLFFSKWMKLLAEEEYFCYDITSVSSYSEQNEYVKFGYNRDKEKLPQINLAMLYGQKTGLPAYYRRLPGNIADVSTLQKTIKELDFMGQTRLNFVLDKGFVSEENIKSMLKLHHKFILGVPTGQNFVKKIIDQERPNIRSIHNFSASADGLYMMCHRFKYEGKRCYLHIYYNPHTAATAEEKFVNKLLAYKERLNLVYKKIAAEKLSQKKIAEELAKVNNKQLNKFLEIKTTSKKGTKITFKDDEVQKHRDLYAGYFCLLTNKTMKPKEVLEVYRNKDVVENSFDDLKNRLDMKRLRVHSSQNMDSRLFLQFIALIILSRLRKIQKKSKKIAGLSIREMIENLEVISRIHFNGRYKDIVTEQSPLNRDILETFAVNIMT